MIAMRGNRAPSSFKAGVWENSDGEFGIAVYDEANRDPNHPFEMTLEMTPDDMIEMARDLLVTGLRKKAQEEKS